MPCKKKASRRTEPKLFRCTGFGDCNMVFTRSEHLARHARKHTGEKPFQCIVPGCHRMFSRFDNMVQHTHTHEKTKLSHFEQSSENLTRQKPSSLPSMAVGGTTVMVPLPYPPLASPTYDDPVAKLPSPFVQSLPFAPGLPSPPTLLVPFGSPCSADSFEEEMPWMHRSCRSTSISTDSSTGSSPVYDQIWSRRLSMTDLQAPIYEWAQHHASCPQYDSDSYGYDCPREASIVDITADEYEAIQGFGLFSAKPVIKSPPPPSTAFTDSSIHPYSSDTPAHLLRQRMTLAQESCLRPTWNAA